MTFFFFKTNIFISCAFFEEVCLQSGVDLMPKLDDDGFFFYCDRLNPTQTTQESSLEPLFANIPSKSTRSHSFVTDYPRWDVAKNELVDIAMVLFQQDLLPPYVILEIYDSIPHRRRIPHNRKIETILSVRSSIRKIREK